MTGDARLAERITRRARTNPSDRHRHRRPDERTRERRDSHDPDTRQLEETAAIFRRLLVAFDGSSHAQRALAQAIELAQTNRARLTVMTVVPEPSAWAPGSGYELAIDLNDLNRQLERKYDALLDSAVDTIPDDPQSRRSAGAAPLARRSSRTRARAITT